MKLSTETGLRYIRQVYVWVVCTSRDGCGSESTAPTRASAARPGDGEEGGAGNRLFIVRETELLECQYFMGSGECRKDNGVGDIVDGVGEVRIEATQKGEDELRVLHGMGYIAKSGGLSLQPLAVRRDGAVPLHHGVEFIEEKDGAWLPVGAQDPLNGHPQIVGSWIGVVHGEVEDGVVNGAGDI
jgi:hypothetical protein